MNTPEPVNLLAPVDLAFDWFCANWPLIWPVLIVALVAIGLAWITWTWANQRRHEKRSELRELAEYQGEE